MDGSLRVLSDILEASTDLVLTSDSAGRITFVNSAGCLLLGRSREHLIGTNWVDIYAPSARSRHRHEVMDALSLGGSWQGKIAIEALGAAISTSQVVTAHRDANGTTRSFSAVVRDLRDHNAMKTRIHRLLHYDALTGLPRLAHMRGLMRGLIERARRGDQLIALTTLNIDGFRLVNEGFGRVIADALLKHAAGALSAAMRPHDTIARVGTDEFLAILTELASPAEAYERTRRMLEAISAPGNVAGHRLRITATAGVAIFPGDGATFETLVSKSSAAMHDAKATLRGGLQCHLGSLKQPAQRRMRLESGLSNAIGSNQLRLHYQTQYNLDTGDPCGVEALARWIRPGGKSVSPAVFIPLAEQTGLIDSLGTWVLQTACKTVLDWHMPDEEPPLLCVNVSTLQISAGFADVVERVLEATRFPAGRLELEITESALMRDISTGRDCLLRLRTLGVRIAVDDFGTGYSGLSYLATLPLNRLKIDKSLTHGMITDTRTAAIVGTIISLGQQLGLEVLAEGVETEQQREALKDAGCLQAQGYLLGRPMPARRARAQFRNGRPEPVLVFAPRLLSLAHRAH